MKNNQDKIKKLFLSSGCFTEDAIVLYLKGNAGEDVKKAMEEHLATCELCSSSVEGFRLLLEDKPAAEIPAMMAGIKGQVAARAIQKQRRNYIRPLLAMAAMLILVFASLIIFRTLNKEKEPVLAKLSVPEIKKESTSVTIPKEVKPILKPEIHSDAKPAQTKTTVLEVFVNENAEPQMISREMAEDEKKEETALNKPVITEAPTKDVQIITNIAAGASGTNKSLYTTPSTNNYTSQNEMMKQDSFVLATEQVYHISASVPQSYTIVNSKSKKSMNQVSEKNNYSITEVNPEYPGGQDSMYSFIARNMNYPEKAKTLNIQGTVNISFYVEKDGRLSEIKVQKGLGYGCDDEAVRVFKLMPEWIPGKQNGKEARVKMVVPVKFSI